MNARWLCLIALSCTPPHPAATAELAYTPSTFVMLLHERSWIMSSTSNRCEPFRFIAAMRSGFQRVYLDAIAPIESLDGDPF